MCLRNSEAELKKLKIDTIQKKTSITEHLGIAFFYQTIHRKKIYSKQTIPQKHRLFVSII